MSDHRRVPEARSVDLAEAVAPLVVAIDIGSTSTRCCLYDGYARPVKKRTRKAEHAFIEAADGTAEIDAEQLADEVATVMTEVLDGLDPGLVEAVVMDTFASSLVCVDADGHALTPCFTYADSRSAGHLTRLRAELVEEEVHQRTGTRLHTSYHPAKLLWLTETRPEVVANTARYLSLGEYIYARLAGVEGCAASTMAWAGILNRHTMEVDDGLLAAVGARHDQFAPIVDPDRPIVPDSPQVAERWPALAGAAWFPAIPDGYASNLGVGADSPEVAALSAATSGAIRVIVSGTPDVLPSGLWSYSVSRSQSIVGGALNDVGRVLSWLRTTLAPVTEEELHDVFVAPPASGTPLVLPFFTGERATGWAGNARAVFSGVSSASTVLDLWRGAAEGVAVSYARVFEQLRRVDPDLDRVIASGGVTGSYSGFMQIVAQAIGFPVQVVDVKRVTMRGGAVLALSVLRPGEPVAAIPETELTLPADTEQPYYEDLLVRFTELYRDVIAP